MRAGALALVAAVALTACRDHAPPAPLTPVEVLGASVPAGFARATVPREFRFPRDHGAHPSFQTEWWYLTGHLLAGGEEFGYQLSFFRYGLRPGTEPAAAGWSAGQLYLAHFALTDVASGRFHAAERFSRGSAGLAGAAADDLDVWVEDFALRRDGDALRIRAADGGYALELQLTPAGAVVLNGERGLHRKGPAPGNASYYYSLPRLTARGTLRVPRGEQAVTGDGWLDREWSSGVLAPEQRGWDWFALKLDDGSALMLYRLRDREGAAHPYSGGTFMPADGAPTTLTADDVGYLIRRRWTSPATGARYPLGWRIEVPRLALEFEVEPLVEAQELDLSFRYWEGAAAVAGARAGRPLAGRAYVELTGYD